MSTSSGKRILVMMSTYNGEKHICAQIDSILNQEINHEVHLRIRDDGSSDHTCKIIEEYITRYPEQVELVKGENIGYNASFFSLIQGAADYDYYSISDQDDVWLPNKLRVACNAINGVKSDVPVLYASTSYLVHDDLKPYGVTRKKERDMTMYNTIIQNICPGHTQVMNNKLLEILKGDIDTSRIYVYDSWIQNMANLYGELIFDNNPYTYYRQYDGNQMGYGVGVVGQLFTSLKRTKSSDGMKYRRQIEYFFELNKDKLEKEKMDEGIRDFINAINFISRMKFFFRGRLYRQCFWETIAHRISVMFGKC